MQAKEPRQNVVFVVLCPAVRLQEMWVEWVNMNSVNYPFNLCREKQINLYLQKHLTAVRTHYMGEVFVIRVATLLCFAKFKRIIF